MPLAPSLSGGLIWFLATIYMLAFELCRHPSLICPSRLGAGQFGLAGRGSMIVMPRPIRGSVEQSQESKMARKPATRVEFTLFDVVYEDGSVRSNRRVPSDVLGGLDGDAAARAVIEEQDRIIAEKSGTPAVAVKSIHRSGSKKADEATRSSR